MVEKDPWPHCLSENCSVFQVCQGLRSRCLVTELSAESAKVSTLGPKVNVYSILLAKGDALRDSSSMCENRAFNSIYKTRRFTQCLQHVQNAHHVRRADGATLLAVILRSSRDRLRASPSRLGFLLLVSAWSSFWPGGPAPLLLSG
jgi:hypothetical protein